MMTMTSLFCTVIKVTVAITLGYQEEFELDRKMAKMIVISASFALIMELFLVPMMKPYFAGKALSMMSSLGFLMFSIGFCIVFNASNEDWATYETPYYVNLSLSSMFSQIKQNNNLLTTEVHIVRETLVVCRQAG